MVVTLLLFGAKKLPELARGVGKAMGEFKRARDDFEREITHAVKQAETDAIIKEAEAKEAAREAAAKELEIKELAAKDASEPRPTGV